MSDLVSPASRDLFGFSIKLLSQNLRKLEIRVVADESLLSNADWTSFCNIENLNAMFHPLSSRRVLVIMGVV
jgi:hypothetical protein